MKVKNLNGTSNNTCKCSSWLQHWKNYSGQTANQCAVKYCVNSPAVGGHVQKDSFLDQHWYIVPICTPCNLKKGQGLDIDDKVNLVSANVAQTCAVNNLAQKYRFFIKKLKK